MQELKNWKKLFIRTAFINFQLITAYNIDEKCAKIFTEPRNSSIYQRNSYFGYSVALYSSNLNSLLLIGAPRGNSSGIPDVEEPGVVYRCEINGSCREWIFSRSTNGQHPNFSSVRQIKSFAWIGASIGIENSNMPKIVICGPRWRNEEIAFLKGSKVASWYMNGICYWTFIKSPKTFEEEVKEELIPLMNLAQQKTRARNIPIYNFGMGEAGFSLHIPEKTTGEDWSFLLGCPGIFNWRGSPVLIKGNSTSIDKVIPNIKDDRNIRSGDYFGYSTTSGCYFKPGDRLFASSAPRSGSSMHGDVFIYKFAKNNQRLVIRKVIQGYQTGEYFGASLASCDLNNDGKDDLIVGAPHWSRQMDEGRVYIFMSRHQEASLETRILEGEKEGGRFGTSISCLGDINKDGYKDLAIGSPYENGIGAVYIFHGEKNGLIKKYSQKIFGSTFSPDIRGFGFSISEPRDINNDEYPDIAVGAYLSGHVVLLKSRQIIALTTEIVCNDQKELLKNSTYFFIDVCVSYRGLYVPETLKVTRNVVLDDLYERAFYLIEDNKLSNFQLETILYKNTKLCDQLKIHLESDIQNMIDPLKIQLSVAIEEPPKKSNNCLVTPIVQNEISRTEDILQLPFAVDCGVDNSCLADLEASLSTNLENNRFVIGSAKTFQLNIRVTNEYEPAYQTLAKVYIPGPLSLASVPRECMENFFLNGTVLVTCYMGNPLRENKNLTLELDTNEIDFDTNNLTLAINVNTQSDEVNLLNNADSLTIYFDMEFALTIVGKTQENLIYVRKEEEENNFKFHHIYEVQKFGASPIKEVVVTFAIPIFWDFTNKQIQIVSVNQPVAYKNGRQLQCDQINLTNYLEAFTNYSTDLKRDDTIEILSLSQVLNSPNNFSIGKTLPPNNRTLFINCTDRSMKCMEVKCELGEFESTLTVAKIVLTLNLEYNNLKDLMDEKDIIFYVSDGKVVSTDLPNRSHAFQHKPDNSSVATTFIGSPPKLAIAEWIVAVSVFLGILLLVLLILILLKLGFFERKKKEELEALKAESNRISAFTLVVNSSKEELTQDEQE